MTHDRKRCDRTISIRKRPKTPKDRLCVRKYRKREPKRMESGIRE
jgi:hypothetical protein